MSITPFPSQGQYPWYDQLEQWGADTQTAAESAELNADGLRADVATALADSTAASAAAIAAAGLVDAPAGDAVLAAISEGGAARDEMIETIRRKTGTVSIDDFNPDDGFADALNKALDAAGEHSTVVFTPNKTYESDAQVNRSNEHVSIDMQGAKIVRGVNNNGSILKLDYDLTQIQQVSTVETVEYTWPGAESSVVTNVSEITVSDGSVWNVGDDCKIFSDDLIPWSIDGQAEKVGDAFTILAKNGNKLYSSTPLRVPLTTNIRIGKYTNKRVTLKNFHIEDHPDAPVTRNSPGVLITLPNRLELIDVVAKNLLAEGFRVNSPFNTRVTNPHGDTIRTSITHSSYGYVVRENAPVDTIVQGGSGRNLRHIYTTGASDNTPFNSSDYWRYGGAVNVVMTGGVAGGTGHSAWDLHDDAVNCLLHNQVVRFNHREPYGSQSGVKIRGRANTVHNLNTHGPGGLNVEFAGTGSGDHTIIDHVHVGLPGLVGGSAVQLSNFDVTRQPAMNYSGSLTWENYTGTMFSVGGIDLTVPRLNINVSTEAGTSGSVRLIGVKRSKIVIDVLNVDISKCLRTSSDPVIVYSDTLGADVTINTLNVYANGVPYRLGALGNVAGNIKIGVLNADTKPNVFNGGFQNTPAEANVYVGTTNIGGVNLADSVLIKENANHNMNAFTENTVIYTTPLSVTRTVTESSLGTTPGRKIRYVRAETCTGSSLVIGDATLDTAGTFIERQYVGSVWVTVGRGSLS